MFLLSEYKQTKIYRILYIIKKLSNTFFSITIIINDSFHNHLFKMFSKYLVSHFHVMIYLGSFFVRYYGDIMDLLKKSINMFLRKLNFKKIYIEFNSMVSMLQSHVC